MEGGGRRWHLLGAVGGLGQKGHRQWVFSAVGCLWASFFWGRTDAGGHLSVGPFLGACPGFGLRFLQTKTLRDVGVVTAAHSLRFPSPVSPCLLTAFQSPEKLGHMSIMKLRCLSFLHLTSELVLSWVEGAWGIPALPGSVCRDRLCGLASRQGGRAFLCVKWLGLGRCETWLLSSISITLALCALRKCRGWSGRDDSWCLVTQRVCQGLLKSGKR